jgi:subtilisin-like proprotein convertase family protein
MASPAFAVVFSNPASITVNDAVAVGAGNPYPSNIAVSGLTGTVTNVTVTLNNLTSTFPDDTDVLLVAPNGNNLILMSDTGGSDDITNTTLTFDDAAATTLPDATKLLTGAFKPTNVGTGDTFPAPAPAPSANTTLATSFNGIDPNGTWNLYVVDDLGADMGVFGNGWTITLTTSGSAATTFSNGAAIHGGDGGRGRATPYASTIVASGLTGAITDLNVTLTNVAHLNPDDLDIMLIGPSGKRITLLSDAGGTTDVLNVTLTFDDAAAGSRTRRRTHGYGNREANQFWNG